MKRAHVPHHLANFSSISPVRIKFICNFALCDFGRRKKKKETVYEEKVCNHFMGDSVLVHQCGIFGFLCDMARVDWIYAQFVPVGESGEQICHTGHLGRREIVGHLVIQQGQPHLCGI